MRSFILIIAVLLLVLIVDMPATLTIGKQHLYRPLLAFNFSGISFNRDLEFRLGLDLQGGSHLVYETDTSKVGSSEVSAAVDATRNNIERRVNLLGVSESLVQTGKVGDKYRLIVELPGVKDVKTAIDTIGATAQLEFREVDQTSTASGQTKFLPTNLTGQDLKLAQVQFGNGSSTSTTGAPSVGIEFSPDGAKKFGAITKRLIGKPLAIFLDNQLITAPTVQQEISDGKAVISGSFTVDEAKKLTIELNAGALPLPIKIVEQRNVGATLGTESIAKSLFAGVIGLLIVWLFMIANYGFKGFLADLALTFYILMALAIFKLIPVTLTLAGIAGFILSVGMAVDANILIFERIKEEIRWGRPVRAALELGFHRAWTSVRDSNASSLITASILFWFGTGPVRGFALTLIVGILVSLFTSVTVTRSLLRFTYSNVPSFPKRGIKGEI